MHTAPNRANIRPSRSRRDNCRLLKRGPNRTKSVEIICFTTTGWGNRAFGWKKSDDSDSDKCAENVVFFATLSNLYHRLCQIYFVT